MHLIYRLALFLIVRNSACTFLSPSQSYWRSNINYFLSLYTKVAILLVFAIIFSVSIYGGVQVKDGLDVTDVVPKGTKVAEFLEARNEYFSFYNIFIITKEDFDYANEQEKLYELHNAFSKVCILNWQPKLTKNMSKTIYIINGLSALLSHYYSPSG